MADDIVTRLRIAGFDDSHPGDLLFQAADEIERLRAERDDHKARLAVEAVTAPDADYDTMVDSLQARLSDLHAEIERLRRWKSEATTVIENWEAVWEAAGSPGVLGQSKSLGLLGELGRLDDEIERLRAAVDSLLADIDTDHEPDETGRLCRTCGAGDGSWPCVHRMALDELKEARRG